MGKKAKTTKEKQWMNRVADLGCLICGNNHVVLHHITTLRRGFGTKSSNYAVLPLCFNHHDAKIKGESIHEDVNLWESKYGSQISLLEGVYNQLGESSERYNKVVNKEIY